MIAMALPEDPLKSDEATSGDAPAELPFVDVARHLAEQGLRVPAVYLDATADKVLLLEDLGDIQLVDKVSDAAEDTVAAWYEAAVALLVDMHEKMWPVPHTCIAAKRNFGFDLLRWELDHYREWGVESVTGPLASEIKKKLDAAFDDLASEIDRLPKGFVHRDYQSRNLMVLKNEPKKENLAIIDFQDAFKGPRIYDLVALLNDSYVNLTWQLKDRIIESYADHRGLDARQLKEEFLLVTIQRKLKDGGRFIFIDRVKNNPAYLPFVDTSFRRVKEALSRLPGHAELKVALQEAAPTRFHSP